MRWKCCIHGRHDRAVHRIARIVASVETSIIAGPTVCHGFRSRSAGAGARIGLPRRRRWGRRVDRRTGRDGQQVGPGARNDLRQCVATATHRYPSTACNLVRKVVQRQRAQPVARRRQSKLCEWIDPVGVAAVLADENLR